MTADQVLKLGANLLVIINLTIDDKKGVVIIVDSNDVIRGRRLTNTEWMHLMLPDIPDYSEIIDEVCKPFIISNNFKIGDDNN